MNIHPRACDLLTWLATDEARRCTKSNASGVYLENRIKFAFEAGWDKCERRIIGALTEAVAQEK